VALIADGLNVQVACDLAGVSQATHYRRMNPPALGAAPIPQKDRVQPATLTTEETGRIVGFLVDEENADLSVNEVFFRCWEDGIHIASLSAWQRIARARNLTGDRRRLATHKPRAIPVLCASRPNVGHHHPALDRSGTQLQTVRHPRCFLPLCCRVADRRYRERSVRGRDAHGHHRQRRGDPGGVACGSGITDDQ
jgi:hypothetical protein